MVADVRSPCTRARIERACVRLAKASALACVGSGSSATGAPAPAGFMPAVVGAPFGAIPLSYSDLILVFSKFRLLMWGGSRNDSVIAPLILTNCIMEKLSLYRTALDAAVFIRQFMFKENFYSRKLDDELQLFIDFVLKSVRDFILSAKDEKDN